MVSSASATAASGEEGAKAIPSEFWWTEEKWHENKGCPKCPGPHKVRRTGWQPPEPVDGEKRKRVRYKECLQCGHRWGNYTWVED